MSLKISVTGSVPISFPGSGRGKATAFLEILETLGFQLSNKMDGALLVAIDHNESMYQEFLKQGGSTKKAFLLRLEPKSVYPSQYRKSITKKYLRVITPGSIADSNISSVEYGWPYQYHANPSYPKDVDIDMFDAIKQIGDFDFDSWKSRDILLSLVAANKVSPIGRENYSIRRKVASEISPDILKVYGLLWTDSLFIKLKHRLSVAFFSLRQGVIPNPISIFGSLFKNYPAAVGPTLDKHLILRNSKFSLVIENSNSYASEKLFDALLNQTIPIYVGPSLQSLGLPKDLAFESNGTANDIMKAINDIDDQGAKRILQAGEAFLKSELFIGSWTEKAVYSKISNEILTCVEGDESSSST